jgi:NtrC-family two-component system sensor histidine kinase KinB
LVISTIVALALARSILHPIQELTSSVEALRAGDFERRVPVVSHDELGSLAVGFNRMAETLAEFRRQIFLKSCGPRRPWKPLSQPCQMPSW